MGYELQPIKLEDMERIRVARNEQIDVLRQAQEISKEEQINYFNTVISPNLNKPHPEMILFSFFKDAEWIGYGGLVHIDWVNKHAEVSFLVETERANNVKTYKEDFTDFLKLLCSKAFATLNLHRLYTETFDFRAEHIQVLEQCGFKEEGVLREHLLLNGTPHHSIMHGLLAKEFLK